MATMPIYMVETFKNHFLQIEYRTIDLLYGKVKFDS